MFPSNAVGIDLGTSSVIIYVKGKGVVLNEPSVVALDRVSGRILEVGEEARKMLGRTPGNIVAVRPLRDGVINDYDITEKMLRFFLKKIAGRRFFFKPRVVVCVPSGVTELERRSVVEATLDAGAQSTRLIEEPIAAAVGAGIDILKPYGSMVVDIGGGTTDIAVISMGKAVLSSSSVIAGDAFDDYIIKYMKKRHNLLIGERTAEALKIHLGGATQRPEELFMEVSGRNVISGMPKIVNVSSDEVAEALEEPVNEIMTQIHDVLERTPPELAADIFENGIVLTGGGALLYNLDAFASYQIKIPCKVAKEPITCVARGTGIVLENMDRYGDVIFDYKRSGNYMNV